MGEEKNMLLKRACKKLKCSEKDIKKWNLMRQNCISEAKRYLPANAMKKLIDIVNG